MASFALVSPSQRIASEISQDTIFIITNNERLT